MNARGGSVLALLWLLIAIPATIVLAPLIPPAESPDEGAHMVRAASLLHGDLTGTRTAIPMPDRVHVESLLHADPGLTRLMDTFRGLPPDARKVDPALAQEMRSIHWEPAPALFSAQTAVYPPAFYLPAAAGLAVARWVGALPFGALVAARLANAAAALLIGAAALALASRGRLLMFAALALPMSVWLAASVHPDAVLLACFGLVLACTGRAMTADDGHARWGSAVLLGCIVAMKPPLAPLAGLLLLPFRRPALGSRLGAAALAVIIGAAWTGFAQQRASIPVTRGAPYEAGPLYPGPPGTMFASIDPAAQLRVLAATPRRIVTLPLRAIIEGGRTRFSEAVGVLGQLDLELPSWLYRLWSVALAAAIVGDMAGGRRARAPGMAAALFIASVGAACVLGIYLTLYLTWTPVGAPYIEGVQGRYLLPPLAMAGLALPVIRLRHARAVFVACTAVVAGTAALSAAVLPGLALHAYYAD